jgi:uncharacterized protein YecA (UPF0149 family)
VILEEVKGGIFTWRQCVMNIGRNDSCPCGSGKKYKKCCLGKAIPDEIREAQA